MRRQFYRWLGWWLARYRWYRRCHGGHWERGDVDVPVCSDIWHEMTRCSRLPPLRRFVWDRPGSLDDWVARYTDYTGRPTPLCRGTPICEEYTT